MTYQLIRMGIISATMGVCNAGHHTQTHTHIAGSYSMVACVWQKRLGAHWRPLHSKLLELVHSQHMARLHMRSPTAFNRKLGQPSAPSVISLKPCVALDGNCTVAS